MTKLTVKKLESLSLADVGLRLTDEHSLYGLVKAKGKSICVRFRWRYRFEGVLNDYSCGTWPTKSLREIRDVHEKARQLLSKGVDPNHGRRIARLDQKALQAEELVRAQSRIDAAEALSARLTVSNLFDRWCAVELIRRKDGGKEIQRMFAKDVLPAIGSLALEDVRKGHVTDVTDRLLARGVNRMAKMIFSLIRQMFRFAVDRDFIEADPTASIRKSKIGGKDVERDRVLSEEEIRDLYLKIPSAGLIPTTISAIWIALSTGCRIGELLRAEWRHVRLDDGQWLIPAENSKNGRPHLIYLSEFAIESFRDLKKINGLSNWCFPNRNNSDHVCVKTVTKQIGDRQRNGKTAMSHRSSFLGALILSDGKWTPHDLRRTAATLMTSMGVLPEVADKCLNHTEENRMKRTYQQYSYEKEKREAWDLLGKRLQKLLLSDGNVISISRFGTA